jgi:hypothetical protein
MSQARAPKTFVAQTLLSSPQLRPQLAIRDSKASHRGASGAMNGFAPPGVASVWAEAKAQDGRTYFYNSATKQTTWEKPAELMTDNEVCLHVHCILCARLTLDSARLLEHHGKHTRRRMVAHTGITQKPRRQLGPCPTPSPAISTHSRTANRLSAPRQRECLSLCICSSGADMTRSAAWAAGPSFAPQQHQRNFDRDDNQYAIADRRERDREAGYGGDRGAPAFTPGGCRGCFREASQAHRGAVGLVMASDCACRSQRCTVARHCRSEGA